jgi:hypothetical protein
MLSNADCDSHRRAIGTPSRCTRCPIVSAASIGANFINPNSGCGNDVLPGKDPKASLGPPSLAAVNSCAIRRSNRTDCTDPTGTGNAPACGVAATAQFQRTKPHNAAIALIKTRFLPRVRMTGIRTSRRRRVGTPAHPTLCTQFPRPSVRHASMRYGTVRHRTDVICTCA